MVPSKKCLMCNKVCRKNQLFTSCSNCKNLVHQKCTELPPKKFKELYTPDCPTPYACTNCFSESLPVENDSFCNAANTDFLNDSNFDNAEGISRYYSMSDLNSVLTSKAQNDLFILHLNIVSLVKYIDELKSTLSKTKVVPDIICLTETRLMDKKLVWQKKLIKIPNYDLFSYVNSPTTAGGVAIYTHISISEYMKRKPELRLDVPECETVFFEMDVPKKSKFLFGCLYRHPRRTKGMKTDFIEKLYANLEMYADKNVPIVLLGDVNINVDMSDDNTVQSYTDMLASVGCRNLINVPTNFWKTGRSTLDHVITSVDNDLIEGGVLNNGKPGHLPIFAVVKNQITNHTLLPEDQNDEYWQFIDERKKEQFLVILEKQLASVDLSKHPEAILASLTKATRVAIDTCFPLKKKSNRAKKRSLIP